MIAQCVRHWVIYPRVSQSGCPDASPGVPQNNLIIFGIHQHHFSSFNLLDPLCSVKQNWFVLYLIELFCHLHQLCSPKMADLQAHSVSRCDPLWACRSAIFVNVAPRIGMLKVQVVKSIKLFSVSSLLMETDGHFSVTCCISGGKMCRFSLT